jgi:AraC family transcriptional regulator
MSSRVLADRVSEAVSKRFKMPPPPTIQARIAGSAQLAISRFSNSVAKPGLSGPPEREEAFILNVPLIPARYSVVSINGHVQSVVQSPGKAYLFDLTSRNEVSLDALHDSVLFHIPRLTLETKALEAGLGQVSGLYAKQMGEDDPVLHHLALALLPAIEDPTRVPTAFVEYVALAVHDHAARTYGGLQPTLPTTGRLTTRQLRRALDFIEANLGGDPSITALSKECGLSTSYFARAFRASVGIPPHKWIMKRRITRAKSLIAQSDHSLADIAFICGFSDQSHLGRQFLKQEGVSPAEWREMI